MTILAIVLLLLLLILLLRVGILAEYRNGALTAHVKIAFFRFAVYPKKEELAAKTPPPEQALPPAQEKAPWRPTRTQMGDGVRRLAPVLEKALHRTRRRVRIDPCYLLAVFGGTEPDEVAQHYGRAQSAVWAVMPRLEELLNLPVPDIRLRWDFEAHTTVIEGRLGASACIGDLLLIALGAGLPALRWLLSAKRESRRAKQTPQTQVSP